MVRLSWEDGHGPHRAERVNVSTVKKEQSKLNSLPEPQQDT